MIICLLTVIVCLLVYFISRVDNAKKEPQKPLYNSQPSSFYANKRTSDQQIIGSYWILAGQFKCLPDKVKQRFEYEISTGNLSNDDLFKLLATFTLKRQEEAQYYKIPAEFTPTGLLAQWTKEYLIDNYIMK